jgi:hypothetical protein
LNRGFARWINVLARIDAVKDSTDNVAQRARLLAPLYDELARLQAEGAQKIKDQGGLYQANIRLVTKFNQILRQQQSPDLLRDLVPDIAAQVDVFARRFEEAKQAPGRRERGQGMRKASRRHDLLLMA